MFGLFRRKPVVPVQIWDGLPSRLAHIIAATRAHRQAGRLVVLVCHFPDTVRGWEELLSAESVAYTRATPDDRYDASAIARLRAAPGVLLLPSETLGTRRFVPAVDQHGDAIEVISTEIFPVPDRDTQLNAFLASLPAPSTHRAHTDLGTAFIWMFGSGNLRNQFQLDEGECIEGRMASGGIWAAQRRLAKRQRGNHPADNARDWLQRNLP